MNRSYSRFTIAENTISILPKFPGLKFQRKGGLFCFISICKFRSFRNPFAMVSSLSELFFKFRFIPLVKTKVNSANYGSTTSSYNPRRWVRLDPIFALGDIYINFNLYSLNHDDSPSQQENSHKFCDETRHPVLGLMEIQWIL